MNLHGLVIENFYEIIGTPDYVAPEVLIALEKSTPPKVSYGRSYDFWSIGILVYEIMFGKTPFGDKNPSYTYHNILNFKERFKFPFTHKATAHYTDFIRCLLKEPEQRLKYDGVKRHPLFNDVDWSNLNERASPFTPILTGPDDTSYFQGIIAKKSSESIDIPNRKVYTWNHLPFVGFTYSHSVSDSSEIASEEETPPISSELHLESLRERISDLTCESTTRKYEELEMELAEESDHREYELGGLETITESQEEESTQDVLSFSVPLETQRSDIVEFTETQWSETAEASDMQISALDTQRSALDTQRSVLDTQRSDITVSNLSS